MEQSAYQARLNPLSTAAEPPALIGPNAVIQTLAALRSRFGPDSCNRIARAAGLPTHEPGAMIPESWFVNLVSATRDELGSDDAATVLTIAGGRTADYVANNRIPAVFRAVLSLLPSRIAIPLLLGAFRRHAWTFAGRSEFDVSGAYPGSIILNDAPTCRRTGQDAHTGDYYEAAFQGLLSLASPGVTVTEVECRSLGHPHCRFRITPITTTNSDRG